MAATMAVTGQDWESRFQAMELKMQTVQNDLSNIAQRGTLTNGVPRNGPAIPNGGRTGNPSGTRGSRHEEQTGRCSNAG